MVESRAIYDLLENDIVPLFYDRSKDDVPLGWTAKMKASLLKLAPVFNTNRMVYDYVTEYYGSCADRYRTLTETGCQRARDLAAWRARVAAEWHNVKVRSVHSSGTEDAKVGRTIEAWCQVALGGLRPEDVLVQVYYGRVSPDQEIVDAEAVTMRCDGEVEARVHLFKAAIECRRSGRSGFAVRVLPNHADLGHTHHARLIHWAD
jgi:starch phosphorylase